MYLADAELENDVHVVRVFEHAVELDYKRVMQCLVNFYLRQELRTAITTFCFARVFCSVTFSITLMAYIFLVYRLVPS